MCEVESYQSSKSLRDVSRHAGQQRLAAHKQTSMWLGHPVKLRVWDDSNSTWESADLDRCPPRAFDVTIAGLNDAFDWTAKLPNLLSTGMVSLLNFPSVPSTLQEASLHYRVFEQRSQASYNASGDRSITEVFAPARQCAPMAIDQAILINLLLMGVDIRLTMA